MQTTQTFIRMEWSVLKKYNKANQEGIAMEEWGR